MPRSLLFVSVFSTFALAACGSSSSGTGGNGGSPSSSSSSGNGGSPSSSSAGGGGDSPSTSSSSGTGGSMPITSCSEINASGCFSNVDCPEADRCENKGTSDLPTPCCVPGQRGTGKLDDPCTVDNDCETSLCVETINGYRCSGACAGDSDCPADMPSCFNVPAILGSGSFCLPDQ
ncbi:MAG: hypothetical protein QM820_58435 [Minicystis sp.]